MQGQEQQQAYDRGTSIFSPDGRLYQVEYAQEAVKKGSACVGVRTNDGVALLADAANSSLLLEGSSIEKLHRIDDHLGVASAGQAADGRRLVDLARRWAQRNRAQYEEPIGVEALTKELSDEIHEHTQVARGRPYGVSLIVGGIEDGAPRLFETDPGGTPREWRALAIGRNRNAVQSVLEAEYSEHLSLAEGIQLGARALAAERDDALSPEDVRVATIDVESERYRELPEDEVRAELAELDLGTEEPPDEDDS